MRDYTLENSHMFILNYEIKDGKIILNYADGSTNSTIYTKESEIKILEKMKEQMNYSYSIKNKLNENIKKTKGKIVFWSSFIVINGLSLLIGITAVPILSIIAVILNTLMVVWDSHTCISFHKTLKDIEKNRWFVEEESELNKMLEENLKTLENQMAPSKEFELYKELGEPKFTLNTIDKLSLKDLKRILESIERSESLGVQSTDAFEETLEAFNKVKKKEKLKIKRK